MFRKTLLIAAATALATPALAQDFEDQIEAREGLMKTMALNLGILGGMAKGETEYDSEAAQDAADNIAAIGMIHPAVLFPEGSGNDAAETEALPKIWEDFDDFRSKWEGLGDPAANMKEVAATGQEAIGPALGEIGKACKACHDTYRESDD